MNSAKQFTAGQQLKARWHQEGNGLSLKQFARKLVATGDQVAMTWFDLKKGFHNTSRSETRKVKT